MGHWINATLVSQPQMLKWSSRSILRPGHWVPTCFLGDQSKGWIFFSLTGILRYHPFSIRSSVPSRLLVSSEDKLQTISYYLFDEISEPFPLFISNTLKNSCISLFQFNVIQHFHCNMVSPFCSSIHTVGQDSKPSLFERLLLQVTKQGEITCLAVICIFLGAFFK